jgi:hypothetical protein
MEEDNEEHSESRGSYRQGVYTTCRVEICANVLTERGGRWGTARLL